MTGDRVAEMTTAEYKEIMARNYSPTVDEFQRMEAYDRSVFWRLEPGDHQNLLDQAIDERDKALAEVARLRAQLDAVRERVSLWELVAEASAQGRSIESQLDSSIRYALAAEIRAALNQGGETNGD